MRLGVGLGLGVGGIHTIPIEAFVFAGDSITGGQGVSPTMPDMACVPWGITPQNIGVSNHTLTQIAADIAAADVPEGRAIVVIGGGINDLAAGETSSPVMLTRFGTCVTAARARFPGCAIAICTILPSTLVTGDQETCRTTTNAALPGAFPGVTIIPAAAVAQLAVHSGTYYGDQTHPNMLGREYYCYCVYETLRAAGIPGLPVPAAPLAHVRDIPDVICEIGADSGITDSSGVTSWLDETANDHDFVPIGLSTTRPAYNADDGDGYPSVQFDGSSDGLVFEYSTHPSSQKIDTGAAYTVVVMFRADATGDGELSAFSGTVFEGRSFLRCNTTTITNLVQDDGGHQSEHGGKTFAADVWHTVHQHHNGSGTFRLGLNSETPTGAGPVASWGASTSIRFALGVWLANAGPIAPRDVRIRALALVKGREATALELWLIRHYWRRVRFPA